MFALLATVFLVAEIFSDSCYSIYVLLCLTFNNNHDVCILFVMVNFILCYTCLLCNVCGLFITMIFTYYFLFFQVASATASRYDLSRGLLGLK